MLRATILVTQNIFLVNLIIQLLLFFEKMNELNEKAIRIKRAKIIQNVNKKVCQKFLKEKLAITTSFC